MKKVFSMILALMVLLSMFTFVTSAANEPTLTIKSSKTAPKLGDTITVTVSVSANSKLGALTVDLKYDSRRLEVVKDSGAMKGVFSLEILNVEYSSNTVRYTGVTTAGITSKAADLFTVKFKVIGEGKASLSLAIDEAFDEKDQPVTVKTNNTNIDSTHVHKYEEKIIKDATCTATGEKEYRCICGDVKKEAVPMKQHTPGEWIVTKEATYTEKGVKEQKCTVCGVVTAREEIPVLKTALGDVDGNGKIEALDARNVLKANAGMITLTNEQKSAADVNKDGKIEALDARWILQSVAGMKTL